MATDRDLLRRLRSAPGLTAAGALVVSALVLGLLQAPPLVRTPFVVLATAVVAVRVARRSARSSLDVTVVAVGFVLVSLIALGFAIDALPGGLSRVSWTVTAAALGLGLLAWTAHAPADSIPRTRRVPTQAAARAAAWYVVAAACAAVALAIVVRATDVAERPPLALSVGAVTGGTAALTVSAGPAGGTYELLVDGGTGGHSIDGPFDVVAGHDASRTVRLPATARVTVSLLAAGTDTPLRTVVLDRGDTATPRPTPTGPTPTGTRTPTGPTATPGTRPTRTRPPGTTSPSTTSPSTSPTPRGSTPPPVLGTASPLPTIPLDVP